MSLAHIAYGTTITFSNGFFANITDIKRKGRSVEVIDGTHSTSPDNRMEKVPSDLIDEGEWTIEMFWTGDQDPPTGEELSCTVQWKTPRGKSIGATDAGTGFLVSEDVNAPIKGTDGMKATYTLVCTGLWTRTPSS